MKYLHLLILFYLCNTASAQRSFAYTHITSDDGTGLASNIVSSLYQDEKGFMWVGTDNGLQRFDGSKFIQFVINKPGSDVLPHTQVNQIIGCDSGNLVLAMPSIREFGLFNTLGFTYKKIALKPRRPIPPRAEFYVWKNSAGDVYLNIYRYGILHYNKAQNAFVDDNPFPLPAGYTLSIAGMCEDTAKQQYWFACDSGLCIYDKRSKQTWYRSYNPRNLPVLNNPKLQDRPSQVYLDKQKRIWVFCWPWDGSGQYKYCLDSTGSTILQKDTTGLLTGPTGYHEYNSFYETRTNSLWIYGVGTLFNYDKNTRRFYFSKSGEINSRTSINYSNVYQVLEDKDGSIWIATDRGLYFTSYVSGAFSVLNYIFKKQYEITDIMEMPDGSFWFTSWGDGIVAVDSSFKETSIDLYKKPPPPSWPNTAKGAITLTWCMQRQSATGKIWIGCQAGVLLVYDPVKKVTAYLFPPEFNASTIHYISEDKHGQLWFCTRGGRLIKWSNNKFTVVLDMGSIIYKVFFDRQGLMWLATQENGLYEMDPGNGTIIKQFKADGTLSGLYNNSGTDIEQLNDSTIVYGAGALNFINKNTGKVMLLRYEDGLPSNNVRRLRMDSNGFLWIITSSGLCRYNPANHRITTYGRKDGVVLASIAREADYESSKRYMMFAGSNAFILFKPSAFSSNQVPPNVSITDFKIFNQYIPVDSLMQKAEIKLMPDQNSFSIYFASLSYMQRDKLIYYYKMEGIDKDWISADRWYYENYSLLPPGNYTFKVYCENVEGLKSPGVTVLHIHIKPQFWRTKWFACVILFLVAYLVYVVHNIRLNRLLEMEKLRNRVARDLHDDMGSTLSTINILSAMAKTKMNTDTVKTSEYLTKISDNSQRMMEAMDDIVWSIKPSNDSMQRITARMREFATSVLEAKEIEAEFDVSEEVHDVRLNMEARRDLFLVFKEAINNAAKYSKADKVAVKVNYKMKKLILSVSDNGNGFDLLKADGNGLGNMQKRVDAMNGKLTIKSKTGEGTTVSVTIPCFTKK